MSKTVNTTHIVTSSKGSTGKTLLSSLLFAHYFLEKDINLIGFDTNFMNNDFTNIISRGSNLKSNIELNHDNVNNFLELNKDPLFLTSYTKMVADFEKANSVARGQYKDISGEILVFLHEYLAINYTSLLCNFFKEYTCIFHDKNKCIVFPNNQFLFCMPNSNYFFWDRLKYIRNQLIKYNFSRNKKIVSVIDTNFHIGSISLDYNDQIHNVLDDEIIIWFIWDINTIKNDYDTLISAATTNINRLTNRTEKPIVKVRHVIYYSTFLQLKVDESKIKQELVGDILTTYKTSRSRSASLMDIYNKLIFIQENPGLFAKQISLMKKKNIIYINDLENSELTMNDYKNFQLLLSGLRIDTWDEFKNMIPNLYERFKEVI